MKGNNVTFIPGEIASAAKDKRALSAEGLYDYILGLNQEELNLIFLHLIDELRNLEKTKHIILSEEQYENLEEYEDALYFVLEPVGGDALGDPLPLTLN